MFRIVLSILALVSLVAVQPLAVAAQTPAARARAAAKAAAPGGQVNINTASAADLDALPGIGAKTAALIVEYRQKNGPFKKVDELMNVRGIGEKNFLKLKPQLTVGGSKAEPTQQPQR
jgi:competence protein ComEA